MKAKIVQIGNSKGIRLPKSVIEQYQLDSEVELDLQDEGLFLRPSKQNRRGWQEAFESEKLSTEKLIDDEIQNDWDETEWKW